MTEQQLAGLHEIPVGRMEFGVPLTRNARFGIDRRLVRDSPRRPVPCPLFGAYLDIFSSFKNYAT